MVGLWHNRRNGWTLRSWKNGFTAAWTFIGLGVLAVSAPSLAAADDCLLLSGSNPTNGKCVVSTARSLQGTFTLATPVEIAGTGNVTVPNGGALTLHIAGGLTIATPTTATGGRIVGDAVSSTEPGASITIHTTGDIVLQSNARLTAEANAKGKLQSYCPKSYGGSIDLKAEGNVVSAKGALISTSAKCAGGEIAISAAGDATLEGYTLSQSLLTGTTSGYRGGGPISVTAGGTLSVKETALVSSKGLDHGADLVHLQGGCQVDIFGLVESTGPGHVVPTNPPNRCNLTNRPHNTTIEPMACVEVWSGGSLTIDRAGVRKGEISADTGQSGGTKIAWIDLFAAGDINVQGHATKYAVHANQFLTNGSGGLVAIKSLDGKVTTSGAAVQANVTANGGRGGQITIESGGMSPEGVVTVGNATVQAKGSSAGFKPAGGTIVVRGMQDKVEGTAPGKLDATGGLPNNGAVTLQGCGAPAVSYTGTATPLALTLPAQCNQTSVLPSYVTLPTCERQQRPGLKVTKSCTSTPLANDSFSIAFSGTVCNTGTADITLTQLTDDQPVVGTNIFPSLSKTTLPAPQIPSTGEECALYNGTFVTANSPSIDTVTAEGVSTPDAGRVSASGSSTCAPQVSCGNFVVEAGEQCDDGNANDNDACRTNCRTNICGDGARNPAAEQCDDGNSSDNDACRTNCRTNVCGDGVRNPATEQCDDGNKVNNDGCKNTCTLSSCGDGVRNPATEQCDDGNSSNADNCKNDCTKNLCGDGIVNLLTEQCDDGNADNTDSCQNSCTLPVCGDGVVAPTEQCDDGNSHNSDGCSSTCQNEIRCGDGIVNQASEQCDDGNADNTDSCTTTCQNARCGDGIVKIGEECDDANSSNTDSCTNGCLLAACGDGFLSISEQCDDANTRTGDGCSSTCQTETSAPVCGNGIEEEGEECDDGNDNNSDDCTKQCTLTPGHKQFMTGGGNFFAPDGTKITHGFTLHCDSKDKPNNLEINWSAGGVENNFHLEKLTSVSCIDDAAIDPAPPVATFDTYTAIGTGTCNQQPATISWTFTDAGEPGVNDRVVVLTITGADTCNLQLTGIALTGGNHQAH